MKTHPGLSSHPSTMDSTASLPYLTDVYFPPYITLAHLFHAPEGWHILDRRLKQYALQYVREGIAEYEIEGVTYTTKTGDLIIHRPGELHSIRTIPGQIYVCISLVFHFGEALFPLERSLGGRHDCGNYKDHQVERLLEDLVTHYQKQGLESGLKCQALFIHTLSEIEGTLRAGNKQHHRSKKHNRMVLVKNHIINHYHRELDYGQLEQLTGLTKNHMISSFTKTFGVSPGQFLIMVRVQKAKELAIRTGLSIGEIAHRVGYADVHSFGKMFKKKAGYSLSEFCSGIVAR